MTIPEPKWLLAADPGQQDRLATYTLVQYLRNEALGNDYEPSPAVLLGAAQVRPMVSDADLKNVPVSGPAIVVVASRYGALEALAASTLLEDLRPDVKVVADPFLAAIPDLRPRFVESDPWERRPGAPLNTSAIGRSLAWLNSGGLLVVFSHDDGGEGAVRLAYLSSAALVPACTARTETGVPGTVAIALRLGAPLTRDRLASMSSDAEAAGYLRWTANVLSRRHQSIAHMGTTRPRLDPFAARR